MTVVAEFASTASVATGLVATGFSAFSSVTTVSGAASVDGATSTAGAA